MRTTSVESTPNVHSFSALTVASSSQLYSVWSISVNTSSSCSVCGKHCVDEAGLKHHQRLHCQEHVYSCKFCLKPFKALEDKWTHEKNDHRVKRLHYRCSECPQGFYNILKRNRHLREHESKRHICHTYYKEFPQLSKLERHELSHSDNKSFRCQVCQRSFAQASQLKSHLRVHTGERPFKCQRCDKSFNHNVSLKNHIRRYHQGESGEADAWTPRESGEGVEVGERRSRRQRNRQWNYDPEEEEERQNESDS